MEINVLLEVIIAVSFILSIPFTYKISYTLSLMLWAKIFPAKEVTLVYDYEGKKYTYTVGASDDLVEAALYLKKLVEKNYANH